MAYQKCPVCEGTGRVAGDMYSTSVFSTCSVCQGAKIIHSGSGFTPYQKIPKAKIYFHDFNSERVK